MSDEFEESIGEELEFGEDSQDEFGQSRDSYNPDISPIVKYYDKNDNLNKSTVSKGAASTDDYSLDFSEVANETHYSEVFDTEESGINASLTGSARKLPNLMAKSTPSTSKQLTFASTTPSGDGRNHPAAFGVGMVPVGRPIESSKAKHLSIFFEPLVHH